MFKRVYTSSNRNNITLLNKTPTTIQNLGFFHMWLTLVSDPHTKIALRNAAIATQHAGKVNI